MAEPVTPTAGGAQEHFRVSAGVGHLPGCSQDPLWVAVCSLSFYMKADTSHLVQGQGPDWGAVTRAGLPLVCPPHSATAICPVLVPTIFISCFSVSELKNIGNQRGNH